MTYVLHYAPDNASLIIRMALDHRGLPYRTQLVDRASQEQSSAAYRALNPNGLIPTLETPQGPLFETGASPRAGAMLATAARAKAALDGRDFVIPDDVKSIALPALRHRVILSPVAEIEGRSADELLQDIIENTQAPR